MLGLLTLCGVICLANSFNYQFLENNMKKLSCSADFNRCIAAVGQQLDLYQKTTSGYQLLNSTHISCLPSTSPGCPIERTYLTPDASRVVLFTSGNWFLKIYRIVDKVFTSILNYSSTDAPPKYQAKGDCIIIYDNSRIKILRYEGNSTNGGYLLRHNIGVSFSASEYKLSCSSDCGMGIYHQNTGSNSATLHYYQFDQNTSTYSTSSDSITGIYFAVADVEQYNGTYYLANAGDTGIRISSLTTAGVTHLVGKSFPNIGFSPTHSVLSTNVEHWLVVFKVGSTYSRMTLYAYNITTNSLTTTQQMYRFTSPRTLNRPQINSNATFIIGHEYISSPSYNQYPYFLYDCNLPNCLGCSQINACASCQQGFTASLITGACVICNLNNCQRCDYTDSCSVFTPTTSSNNALNPPSNSQTSTETATQESSPQSFSTFEQVVIGLSVLLLMTTVGLVVLCIKLSSLKDSLRRLNQQPQRRDQTREKTMAELVEMQEIPNSTLRSKQSPANKKPMTRNYPVRNDHSLQMVNVEAV